MMKKRVMSMVACALLLAACTTSKRIDSSSTDTLAAAAKPAASSSSSAVSASSAASTVSAPVIVPKPFNEAVAQAAAQLLASLPSDTSPRVVVIDPLLDGLTAEQNQATQNMEAVVRQYIRATQPKFALEPLTVTSLSHKPLLLVGTFTGLNDAGQTAGARTVYRICLALADTATNMILAKGTARSTAEGVDLTPLTYFRDTPTWSSDKVTDGYIRSCWRKASNPAINS